MKILIIKNRYKKSLNWKKGIQWFHDNTPLKLDIEEINTDLELSDFRSVSNGTGTAGVVVGGDYYDKLRTVVPPNKYRAVVLINGCDVKTVDGKKGKGSRINISERTPLYPGTWVIQIPIPNDGGMHFNHEFIHNCFTYLTSIGIIVDDPMDKVVVNGKTEFYFNNKSLTANPSNRTIALDRLKPHWDALQGLKPSVPTVTITRQSDDGKQALGILTTSGFVCKTLERPWLNNQKNISCIPKGEYTVVWSFSPKFAKFTYEILNVPNRSGIRIHPASFWFDLSGCVALGSEYSDINKDGTVDIINSTVTLAKFQETLGKKPFKLIIK